MKQNLISAVTYLGCLIIISVTILLIRQILECSWVAAIVYYVLGSLFLIGLGLACAHKDQKQRQKMVDDLIE